MNGLNALYWVSVPKIRKSIMLKARKLSVGYQNVRQKRISGKNTDDPKKVV